MQDFYSAAFVLYIFFSHSVSFELLKVWWFQHLNWIISRWWVEELDVRFVPRILWWVPECQKRDVTLSSGLEVKVCRIGYEERASHEEGMLMEELLELQLWYWRLLYLQGMKLWWRRKAGRPIVKLKVWQWGSCFGKLN